MRQIGTVKDGSPRERNEDPDTGSASGADPQASIGDSLARATPDGFVLTSNEGRLVAYNDRLLELWGLDGDERAELERLGPTAAAREALDRAVARRTRASVRVAGTAEDAGANRVDEVVLSDGRVLERYVAPVLACDGRRTGTLALHRDVSRRRAVEDELRERARQQAALAAVGELAINVEQLEPLLHAACAITAELLALDAACLLAEEGGRLEVRVAAGPLAPAPGTALDAAGAGFAARLEVPIPGRERPRRVLGVYARGARAFGVEEVRFLEGLASTLGSTVARHEAEQGLLGRERQARAVFDGALDAMVIVSPDGAVVDANGAACALFASRRDALLGRSLDALAPPAPGPARGAPPWASLLAAGRGTGERDVAADGKVRSLEYAIVPGILPERSLVVLRDVSERRQLTTRLALADRMVSVGTLAAGVAHELNNPLAFVSANLVFVGEGLERLAASPGARGRDGGPLAAELQDAVRDAREGAERMRAIIRDLKTFSRGGDERSGPVEIAPVVESCLNMAWNEIRHRAKLVKELAPVPPVFADEGRLGQVFLNLLVNAAQAIPEGNAEAHRIRVSASPAPGDRVAIEISDDGCGIPPEIRSRIFDPFFTTKPPGEGTGLGLAICHTIVSALGGEIDVESEPGRGSTFRVLLPAARPAAPAAARPAPVAVPAAPRARVLVVDDEPLVGTVLQRTLRTEHDVEVVTSARDALARVDGGERFDLVISDLLMPDVSGMDLYRELVERHPRLAGRVLFLTGGAFTPAAREFLERAAVTCLEKPFDLAALRAAVAKKLAGG
jgi:PAS domain S-box-containing protein